MGRKPNMPNQPFLLQSVQGFDRASFLNGGIMQVSVINPMPPIKIHVIQFESLKLLFHKAPGFITCHRRPLGHYFELSSGNTEFLESDSVKVFAFHISVGGFDMIDARVKCHARG